MQSAGYCVTGYRARSLERIFTRLTRIKVEPARDPYVIYGVSRRNVMLKTVGSFCAALIIAAAAFSTSAQAQHHHHGGYRGGGHYGGYHGRHYGGAWGGFAAGAIIGGLLAAPYYRGEPYYYPGPRYYDGPPPDDAEAYCMQRFRSYDPRSGTYLGYDGYRHPCP
jgi:hypothetical protein